ncbi:hypothetical protein POM88_052405 [Heracleum sosnowskyi]|uniref:BHLH domain-containing protein n=1 Tax=Heracleum sosnowskyi TaxID=360622 RepID=A0AAD8GQK2_9APIA|nr:hypothetical protein POM88_052405 [Heracleum sosnowskyi]
MSQLQDSMALKRKRGGQSSEAPNIKYKGGNHYMDAEFEPSKKLTGGEWYADGKLNQELIEFLKSTCKKVIIKLKVATTKGVHEFFEKYKVYMEEGVGDRICFILDYLVEFRVYETLLKKLPHLEGRADNSWIRELISDIGRGLEVSAPQLVHNTTARGGIHHLDPAVSVYPQDMFLNHLRSMPSLAPVADLLISSQPASLADLLGSAPTQQTEYLLQPCMLNEAQYSDMPNNESMMLQIDSNKQQSHKTEGISQPNFVASAANGMAIDRKRKGKEHHGECHTEEAKYKHTSRGEKEDVSPYKKKKRDKHNCSEKMRRKKISEQFKKLQNLIIPSNNKVDQLSVLDGVIAHIKFLKQQVEILSMMNGQPVEQYPVLPSLTNQLAPTNSSGNSRMSN